MPLDAAAAAVSTFPGVPGRMQVISAGQPFAVIVDYAHTPNSLRLVLDALRGVTPGRLVVVFGSAGERDVEKRALMGAIAAEHTDYFVITSEDPRSEDPDAICRAIEEGASAGRLRVRPRLQHECGPYPGLPHRVQAGAAGRYRALWQAKATSTPSSGAKNRCPGTRRASPRRRHLNCRTCLPRALRILSCSLPLPPDH